MGEVESSQSAARQTHRRSSLRWQQAMPRHWVVLLAITVTLSAQSVTATDIYETIDANGAPRYTNHRFDDTSQLIAKYASSQPPDRSSRTGHFNRHTDRLSNRANLEKIVIELSSRYDIPGSLVLAVADVESAYKPQAVSVKGARGVMQLMPATGARYGVTDPFDAIQNITAGILHLKTLVALYDGNVTLALAAYNAGEGAVQRNGNRIPPYAETMLYVPAVLAKADAYSREEPQRD